MSGGTACTCKHSADDRTKFLVVIQRMCNHSAFNGGHRTHSAWSSIYCTKCQKLWRSKGFFVNTLRDATWSPGAGAWT